MTDSNYAHITVVSDRSGSMDTIQGDAEGAINSFIEEQKKQPGRATFTLVQFDDVIEFVHENVDLATVGHYTLQPRNMTALLDAWGKAINSTGAFLDSLPEEQKPATVTVVIVTDGMENASREFTAEQIKAMTEHQRSVYSWEFVFLAAGQDAVQVGVGYGVPAASSMTYAKSGIGTQNTYSVLAGAVNTRRAKGGSVTFSQAERNAAMEEDS